MAAGNLAIERPGRRLQASTFGKRARVSHAAIFVPLALLRSNGPFGAQTDFINATEELG
ncbi:hypothetical protein [Variovorax sp. dw_954]|uniref:hypothetical protein n=1 Tax=Variovorax sp. dw_954 TaxID=2720078 RepID=UPI001BD550E3|nr:hypothetical protein [Variovorax sp. dw_954]